MITDTIMEDVKRMLENHSSWHLMNTISKGGTATKTILSIIPEETLKTIMRIYRVTKRAKDEIESYDKLSVKGQFPKKDFQKIKQLLKKHQSTYTGAGPKQKPIQKWISEDDIDDIMKFIDNRFKSGPKGIRVLNAQCKEIIKKREKTTRPTDSPLSFALYLLAEHLKAKQNIIDWHLVCDFLTEQKVINVKDATFTENTLSDRYRKTNVDKIEGLYYNYRELYLYARFNIEMYPGHDRQRDICERDITLPHWHELIP